MSAKSERPKRRRIKLVGGGFRRNRQGPSGAGSAKSARRAMRKSAKDKNLTIAERKAIKERIREMYWAKNARSA